MNREDSQGKGPGLSSNCKNFQMKPRTFSRIFAGIHGDHWDKHKDKTGRLSSMQPWALGSVFGLKSEMVERQEMLLAPVSAHTHTLGQAGNIWAAVPPPHWSVGAASNTPSSAGSSEIIIEQRLSNKVSNQRLSIGADPGLRAGAALYKISLRWMVPLGHNSKDILNLIPLTRVTWPTICHKGLKFEILYSLREMMRSLVYFSLRSPLSKF